MGGAIRRDFYPMPSSGVNRGSAEDGRLRCGKLNARTTICKVIACGFDQISRNAKLLIWNILLREFMVNSTFPT